MRDTQKLLEREQVYFKKESHQGWTATRDIREDPFLNLRLIESGLRTASVIDDNDICDGNVKVIKYPKHLEIMWYILHLKKISLSSEIFTF